ncbi:MAG: peptidoglycan DD-metalloendopeptidase family protein [Flavobacteriales bacterium]|nr:peptidoglycan DD-metalloendopeptidase family protein [Flavobacteriales bacterium]MCX7650276.1 peptidoglycan DD-metalloendopeptidase family protein [Flavobacteriales bacterium]MDW8431910.1 peptidoglycan DD-metalloendopeptidase family protein [Flavobacteriales bacterium]
MTFIEKTLENRRFKYNPHTLQYEPVQDPPAERIWRVGRVVAVIFMIGAAAVYIAYTFFSSPGEKRYRRELEVMKEQFEILEGRLEKASSVLAELEKRDTAVYRAIFEAPAPQRLHFAALRDSVPPFSGLENKVLLERIQTKMKWLEGRLRIQAASLQELMQLVQRKDEFIRSVPAIMPVKITDLQTSIGGYGMRTDPVYRTPRFHTGLDFIAALGKPIFATGQGRVVFAGSDGSGYGLHVVLDHGFGFRTLYGHMSKILVKPGQEVKRGEKIGLIGCTGKCVGPHVHYEVHKNGAPVNPIHYFYGDLSPEDYETLVNSAETGGQALD